MASLCCRARSLSLRAVVLFFCFGPNGLLFSRSTVFFFFLLRERTLSRLIPRGRAHLEEQRLLQAGVIHDHYGVDNTGTKLLLLRRRVGFSEER